MKVLSKDRKVIELEVDEDLGFLNALEVLLLEDSNVELAYCTTDHPLTGKPKIFIRAKKGSPKEALKKAVRKFAKELNGFEAEFKKVVAKAGKKHEPV
ncbi:MAG: RpoL/Rpb11 RNA polymerase subunit family protein [Candidatus Thermoplasmatota archaeon]|nr:RpoL/Rpb11 RNA polymerase subunit family protein [Candidatus Thermoplasmatota archaeon]